MGTAEPERRVSAAANPKRRREPWQRSEDTAKASTVRAVGAEAPEVTVENGETTVEVELQAPKVEWRATVAEVT